MIVVRLMGGLGNQMFQYALGRALSHRLGVELKLDLSWFSDQNKSVTRRDYQLAALNTVASIATKDDLDRLRVPGRGWFADIAGMLNPFYRKTYIRERGFQFDPTMLNSQDDVYLEGFWQSERYFKEISEILRQEFTLRTALDEHGHRLKDLIVGCRSVSLHFRRGDYVTSQTANKFHGTCSLDYYREAVDVIRNRVSSPHFFIFSDEPSWVRKAFPLDLPSTFIGGDGPRPAPEEMYLMSKCRHHVMANSTFSWWGAWLQGSTGNTVIAPQKWFSSSAVNTSDLLPEQWIRI